MVILVKAYEVVVVRMESGSCWDLESGVLRENALWLVVGWSGIDETYG
jgi:hypothetical protein